MRKDMQKGDFVACGKKVSLRMMTEQDAELIVKWRNSDRVRKNFIYREDFTLEGQIAWKKNMIDTGKVVQMIICDNEEDYRPVGCVYYRDIDNDKKEAEYGIFIGEDDAIGKGFGSETADLATDYARDEMGLKRVILRVFKYNTSAINSYKHAGFVKTEELFAVECSDGQKDDMILMEKRFID